MAVLLVPIVYAWQCLRMAVRMASTLTNARRLARHEARVESLVGDASKAVVGGADESRVSSRVRVRMRQAVHGCVLEGDADAPAGGYFDGLFGLVVEAVELQAATGGRKEVRWVYGSTHVIRAPDRRTPRTIEGSIAWMRML